MNIADIIQSVYINAKNPTIEDMLNYYANEIKSIPSREFEKEDISDLPF